MADAMARGSKTAADVEKQVLGLNKKSLAYRRSLIPVKREIRIYSVNDDPVIRHAGVMGMYLMQPKKAGERFGPPLLIPDPMIEDACTGDWRIESRFDDGLEYAQDVVHGGTDGVDNDLRNLGVFIPSLDPAGEPSEQDLVNAETMLRNHWLRWLKEGDLLASKGQEALITPLSHKSVDKLRVKRGWHESASRVKTCPQCGEDAPEKAIKHACSFIFDWDAALANKIVTRKQYDANHASSSDVAE